MSTSSTMLVFIHLADMERIDPAATGPGRPPPAGSRFSISCGAEGHQSALGVALRVQQPVEPIPDADHLPSQFARRQGRSHDHGIHPRDVAGAHIDGDAPQETAMPYFC